MATSTSKGSGKGVSGGGWPLRLFCYLPPDLKNSGAQEQAVEVVLAHPLIGAAVLKQEAGQR
jgi:hypothetical protein